MYSIYKLTSPNGKVYIGQTKLAKLYDRWGYGCGYYKNEPLYNDILEYGWRNFKHEVLEEVETKEEATKREREYILEFKSNNPEFGYNKHINASSLPKLHTYIRCIETGKLYESMRDAGAHYGVTGGAISYAIKNNTRCVNRHWERVKLTREEYQASKN